MECAGFEGVGESGAAFGAIMVACFPPLTLETSSQTACFLQTLVWLENS